MSHELQNENDMFYVGETPWHRLGTRLIEPPTTEEALKLANMDWTVDMRPLFNEHGDQSTHREIFRMDTNTTLGVVGPAYHPLQNTKAFGWFDPLIQDGTLKYETAGVLSGGKKVWILAKVAGDPIEIVKNDAIERYVLLAHAHDGTLAIRIGFTPIRVVCQNTLQASMESTGSKLIRVRHTANADTVLDKIRDTMVMADGIFRTTAEQYQFLTKIQVTEKDVRKYVETVFDLKNEEDRKRDSKLLENVVTLFTDGKGQDIPGVRGTLWAAYNAVTEQITHHSGRSDEGRLNSQWFGPNAARNKMALDYAIEIANKKAA